MDRSAFDVWGLDSSKAVLETLKLTKTQAGKVKFAFSQVRGSCSFDGDGYVILFVWVNVNWIRYFYMALILVRRFLNSDNYINYGDLLFVGNK